MTDQQQAATDAGQGSDGGSKADAAIAAAQAAAGDNNQSGADAGQQQSGQQAGQQQAQTGGPRTANMSQQQGSGDDAGQQGQDGQQGQGPYRPDGLDEQYVGKTDQETIDNLHKAYRGARKAIGDIGSIPKEAGEYKLEFGEDAQKMLGDLSDADNKVIDALKAAAFKSEVPAGVFQRFVPEIVNSLIQSGVIEEPLDSDAQLLSLGKEVAGSGDVNDQKQAGAKRLLQANQFLDGMKQQNLLSAKEHNALHAVLATDDGVRALEKIKAMATETGRIGTGAGDGGGSNGGQQVTEETIRARMADPRYRTGTVKHDPKFRAETEAMARKFYGEA